MIYLPLRPEVCSEYSVESLISGCSASTAATLPGIRVFDSYLIEVRRLAG